MRPVQTGLALAGSWLRGPATRQKEGSKDVEEGDMVASIYAQREKLAEPLK
jgi:hypothetical protein